MKPSTVSDYSKKNKICDFCLCDETTNKLGYAEKMLICQDCDAKAHPSCMNYSASLAAKALTYAWQCIECKTCSECYTADNGASILFCDGCDKAFHMSCHKPKVIDKPEGSWVCRLCSLEDRSKTKIQETAPHSTNGATTNGWKLTKEENRKRNLSLNGSKSESRVKRRRDSNLTGSPPFTADWSAGQVTDYFRRIGFAEHAHVFVQEEIDGRSLLLLKRSDVIEGMSLKLGPAVKLYEQIANLQNAIMSECTS